MVEFINQVIQQIPLNITGNSNVTLPALPPITMANIFGDLTSTLIVITLMIAIFVRTYSEFIEKIFNGEITNFNPKYIATAIVGFVSGLPLAMVMFPEAAKIFVSYNGQWGVVATLVIVGIYGYGWQHGTNKIVSLVGHFLAPKSKTETNTQDEDNK